MIRYFYFLAGLAALLLLNSCAAVFHSRKCALVTQQDSTQIKLVDEGGGSLWGGSGFNTPTVIMHDKVAEVTLDNRNEYYLVEQHKKGCLPKTTVLSRGKFNSMKLVDIGISFIADMYLISGAGLSTDPATGGSSTSPTQYVAWYFATAGLIDISTGPWKMYNKTYSLPELTHVPYRKSNQNKLYLKDVGFDLKKDSLIRTYYSTYKDYLNKKILYTLGEKKSYISRNSEFQDTLNMELAKWNYIDKGLLSNMYNSAYYIKCSISNMSIITINSLTFFSLKCTWKLYGVISQQPMYESTIESVSKWGSFDESDESFGTYIGDALNNGIVQFLNTDKVQQYIDDQSVAKNTQENWQNINLSGTSYSNSISSAIKSVVTIKTPDGHGSGCIVSGDGYIITNYHVISEDSSNTVKVILSDGDSLDATYVRSNSEYDLALLKLNKPGTYSCFSVSLSKDIPVGSEVYAIGTPEDISLGQTLTKGIISGKRKVNDKSIIQTDVSINPGNSGGALVNDSGVLMGIVTAKLMGDNIQGIGFAIPAHYIEDALKVKFTEKK